jgi:hypothetical protein
MRSAILETSFLTYSARGPMLPVFSFIRLKMGGLVETPQRHPATPPAPRGGVGLFTSPVQAKVPLPQSIVNAGPVTCVSNVER